MEIYKRIISASWQKFMFQGKAIIITGARQVGKTTLLEDFIKDRNDTLWLNADELHTRNRLTNPTIEGLKEIVSAYKIVVIDEIQRIINAGLLLKMLVDNIKDVQFFATGSSALEITDFVFEPMTGRSFNFHLFPLSLAEIYPKETPFEMEKNLPFHLIYGSYPEVVVKRNLSEIILKNLSEQYLYKDILQWKNIRKPIILEKLLQLLSWQIGSEVSFNELANKLSVKSETIVSYIDLLEKAFVVYQLRPFSTNPRKEITKMSKIYFMDNGIRNAVIDNFNPLTARNDQGVLLENFLISERIKMNTWKNPSVKSYFWRNKNQSEVDYVETQGNAIKAYEIKWQRKKAAVSRAFLNQYPNAQRDILTSSKFLSFVRDDYL